MIGDRLADLVVQEDRGARFGEHRSGRRMPTSPEARHEELDRHGASGRYGAIVLCSAAARGEPADACAVAGLSGVRRQPAGAGRTLRSRRTRRSRSSSLGGTSSTLAGRRTAAACLSGAARGRAAEAVAGREGEGYVADKPRQTADEMASGIDQAYCSTKSRIWWYGRPAPLTRCAGSIRKNSRRRSQTASRSCKQVARTSF